MAAPVAPRLYSRLVFDCDGVLVDSERWSCAALADALQQAAGLEIAREYPCDFAPVFGCSVRGAVEHYAAACGKGGEWDVPKVAAEVRRLKYLPLEFPVPTPRPGRYIGKGLVLGLDCIADRIILHPCPPEGRLKPGSLLY